METEKQIQKWKVSDLKPHPRQAEVFPDLTEYQLRDLALDLQRNGLRTPLEILPDGTIVCGHQRARAARLLDWEEIDVRVNQDLASKGPEAVKERLIKDNVRRRQLDRLDRLDMARAYQRLRQLELSASGQGRPGHRGGRLRDIVGDRLGLTGRTLDRLVRVLLTPRAVQEAYRRRELTLILAGQVASLPPAVQEGIAAEITEGRDPNAVVKARLAREGALRRSGWENLRRFLRDLERRVAVLGENPRRYVRPGPEDLEDLRSARSLIDRLLSVGPATRRAGKSNRSRGAPA